MSSQFPDMVPGVFGSKEAEFFASAAGNACRGTGTDESGPPPDKSDILRSGLLRRWIYDRTEEAALVVTESEASIL
jgi:hypothetical protein